MKIELVVGNLVRQPDVDAIVNSANMNLRFGSGVAGAIHSAAGPQLEEYCRQFVPLGLGEAVISPGFHLPNPFVIHVRAASYINDEEPESYLEQAVIAALQVAADGGVQTLAMPAIGTGVFKFPPPLSAEIIVRTLLKCADVYPAISLVRICVTDEQLKAIFEEHLRVLSGRELDGRPK
jgi:O-acetyl-ADP-ribose deacetylase (regulator of RNase III)